MLTRNRKKRPALPGVWKLQDAKARFSEVVRRAQSEGPQHVTVHGKNTVVILSMEDYAKVRPAGRAGMQGLTGADLIPIMQKGRRLGLKLKPRRNYLTARPPVDLFGD
jgi:prevent-host-death family protein